MFELEHAMVIHAMDTEEQFPYANFSDDFVGEVPSAANQTPPPA